MFACHDDVVLVSEDVHSHLHLLEEVFTRFREAGLTLKLSICHLLREVIKYLGFSLNGSGIQTTPDKVESILNFPTPTDVKSVRSFFGQSGFYRGFIKSYSSFARPLTILLRKDAPFTWGTEQ